MSKSSCGGTYTGVHMGIYREGRRARSEGYRRAERGREGERDEEREKEREKERRRRRRRRRETWKVWRGPGTIRRRSPAPPRVEGSNVFKTGSMEKITHDSGTCKAECGKGTCTHTFSLPPPHTLRHKHARTHTRTNTRTRRHAPAS